MSRSSNSLRTSDVITTPIKLRYTASYDCSTLAEYGMTVLNGVNGPVTVTGSIPQDTLNYWSVRHLYYSNFLTGSFPVSASGADNFLQSTAASGTLDADFRYFPTESGARITVLSIPRGVFGERVFKHGFIMSSSAYYLVDDGNGNIIDQAASNVHVGNIIYPQGMVIFTNSNYLDLLECPTTTTTTSTTTTTTTEAPTTTSTTTTTTTEEPTTTSTTTTTTTEEPTTTSTTTTTTTEEPTTTTTTSTTTTTTTAEPTTTTTTTTSTTTTTTTLAYDEISGSFTVSNSLSSIKSALVNLGGYGTGATVAAGASDTLYPTGQIVTPNTAQFTITSTDGTDTVTVLSDTLSCTNASVNVTGTGTTTVTITVTPTNYDGSIDSMSGDISVGIS